MRPPTPEDTLYTYRADATREVLRMHLDAVGWNYTHAAERLGITRTQVGRLCRELGLAATGPRRRRA